MSDSTENRRRPDARPLPSAVSKPVRRPLKIYAFDPMRGRSPFTTLTVDVENERLEVGPTGSRVRVVDYDTSVGRYYAPVNLDDPAILMQGGLDPSETNPCFHQQMVYAVTMKVLENFDRALGRRLEFKREEDSSFPYGLTLLPHAFRGANAYYDPSALAVRFGYFTADRRNPGRNLPGQTVFACLSHDVIAHEVTHALVHRLREHFLEPSNRDVLAFHEGFSDIVAIFQHFTFEDVLRDAVRATRGDLRSPNELVELAKQFGHATGRGAALRTAVDRRTDGDDAGKQAQAKLYDTAVEAHERGSILVAAVFDAFFTMYLDRTEDLIRIATGGTGRLPEGELHPDLVRRIAAEASAAAQTILTMCIRAFDYLPPVDVTYGDFLRALVTADFDLIGDQGRAERAALIESFRLRGIYPTKVASLAEGSLLWPRPVEDGALRIDLSDEVLGLVFRAAARGFERRRTGVDDKDVQQKWAAELQGFAQRHTAELELDPKKDIKVSGFHPTFRVARDGQLRVEFVAQFTQLERTEGQPEFGGLGFRGGTTIVASATGDVRYVISKPLETASVDEEKRREATERKEAQLRYVTARDAVDPMAAWLDEKRFRGRMKVRDFRALHEGLLA